MGIRRQESPGRSRRAHEVGADSDSRAFFTRIIATEALQKIFDAAAADFEAHARTQHYLGHAACQRQDLRHAIQVYDGGATHPEEHSGVQALFQVVECRIEKVGAIAGPQFGQASVGEEMHHVRLRDDPIPFAGAGQQARGPAAQSRENALDLATGFEAVARHSK
jgi:hypothetical protein